MTKSNLMIERQSNLTDAKLSQFKAFLYPSTKKLYTRVKRDLFALHNAEGRKIDIKIDDSEQKSLFDTYISNAFDGIGVKAFFEGRGWQLLFTEPNAVILTDAAQAFLDETQGAVDQEGQKVEREEIYNSIVHLDEIYDIDIVNGVVKYLLIEHSEMIKLDSGERRKIKTYHYYDGDYMMSFNMLGDKVIEESIIEKENFLGYTPARTISTIPRFARCQIQMASPASISIAEANEYITESIMTKHNRSENGYAKSWSIKTDSFCGSAGCRDGKVYDETTDKMVNCQTCQNINEQSKQLYGVHYTIDTPEDMTAPEATMMKEPVGRLKSDVALLENQSSTLAKMGASIINMCTGKNEQVHNANMARNEMEVQSAYDSYENVLLKLQKDIAASYKFIYETVAHIAFKKPIECQVELGDRLYLKSSKEIEEIEKLARENGAPNYRLEELRKEKLFSQYKNNPALLYRFKVLDAVEPLKEYNTNEILSLYSQGLIDELDMIVKLNFVSFVDRYERESSSGVISPAAEDINNQINNLKTAVYGYAEEKVRIRQTPGDQVSGPSES